MNLPNIPSISSLVSKPATTTNPTWQKKLYAPKLAGVPFFVLDHRENNENRLAGFEFPYGDVMIDNMGRKIRTYQLAGYILISATNPLYFDRRDKLRKALQSTTPVELVHPYLGKMTVWIKAWSMKESIQDGGRATFEFSFWEAGLNAKPPITVDSSSNVIGAANQVKAASTSLFDKLSSYAGLPSWISTNSISQLTSFTNGISSTISNITGVITQAQSYVQNTVTSLLSPITSAVNAFITAKDAINSLGGTFGLASTITGVFDSIAGVVLGSNTGTALANTASLVPTISDPFVSMSRLSPIADSPTNDPTYGLSMFPNWGNDFAPIEPTTKYKKIAAANQNALVQFVQVNSIAVIAQIYSQTTFSSVTVANTALYQFNIWINTQINYAGNNGHGDLYIALLNLQSAVNLDMNARAAQLPNIKPYSTNTSMPSLTLSQILYQSDKYDQMLVAMNDVVHPLFMPLTGKALLNP